LQITIITVTHSKSNAINSFKRTISLHQISFLKKSVGGGEKYVIKVEGIYEKCKRGGKELQFIVYNLGSGIWILDFGIATLSVQ
jgi:hypothetical protein